MFLCKKRDERQREERNKRDGRNKNKNSIILTSNGYNF
jgi:hypothetical protein